MERAQNKHMFCPARCPGCGDGVHLVVANSIAVNVQIHNVNHCNATFYYRCWMEESLPMPRVEFLDSKNAMHFTLHPHADDQEPARIEFPPPPELRYPHTTSANRARRDHERRRAALPHKKPTRSRA